MATSTTPDEAPKRNREMPNDQGEETKASAIKDSMNTVVETTSVRRHPYLLVSQPANGIEQDGAGTDQKQQKTQNGFIDGQTRLGIRDEYCPGGNGQSQCQKNKPGGMSVTCRFGRFGRCRGHIGCHGVTCHG